MPVFPKASGKPTVSTEEQHLQTEAETQATEEAQRRQEVEIELERLRAQLANRQNNDI